ncbi:hypothetical protein NZD89_28015 (plasmid) [Alicyclobacillus fastidiosus]|uniref:Uncharacterized protein n=1 Tax=Alicyclobacillus fastidiosus TaxID=392011 RepID=A0ABY6ZPY0_9BACL|nr:DUF4320 family protein [Alicyclobacillus fastidiosus]WAH44896.1 hypothetical protein NZD89_28015 [Alicyclobacillus fastidiosus]GMA65655.1 hypothetical protein GCM10025859_60950 [Alicyclobacillus fastidiosus]
MRDVIIVVLLYFGLLSWNYQPYMDEINGVREQYLQTVASTAISEAKIKGYFTSSDLSNIQSNVAEHLGFSVGEVTINGTTTPMTRGEELDLSISVPSHINLFSLSPSTNQVTLKATASADSEAILT